MLCVLIMGRFVSKKWAIVSNETRKVMYKASKSQDLYVDAGLTKPSGKLSVAQAVCKLQSNGGKFSYNMLCAFKDGEWWYAQDQFNNHKGQADFIWVKVKEELQSHNAEVVIYELNSAFGDESKPESTGVKKTSQDPLKKDWYYNKSSNAGEASGELINLGIVPVDVHYWLTEGGSLEYGENLDLGNGFSVVKHTEGWCTWLELTDCGEHIMDFNYGAEEYSIDIEWCNKDSDMLFYEAYMKHNKNKSKSTTTKTNQTMDANAQLAEAIKAIAGQSAGAVDIEQVKAIVAQEVEKATLPKVVQIEVKLPTKSEPNKAGLQHYRFDELLNLVNNKVPVMLTGDAGSGKTYGAKSVAKALDLDFRIVSFNNEMSLGRTMGFMNANGQYVRTAVRDMYENGGVLILDEFDSANPNVAMALNNLLDGEEYTFDDAQVSRHPEFRYVACTNTYGKGANKKYNARNKMDDATMDRFIYMDWGYDEQLERNIFGNTRATEVVFKIRENANKMGMNGLVTPRRTREVNKMVSIGFSIRDAVQMAILNPHKSDIQKGLIEGVQL